MEIRGGEGNFSRIDKGGYFAEEIIIFGEGTLAVVGKSGQRW